MTLVRAPIEGVVEWRCAPGDVVVAGTVLAWLAGPGRCGLVPMTAPRDAVVRWRRADVLATLEAGAPAVVLGEDPDALAQAQAAEQAAARAELDRVEAELADLARRGGTVLSQALLEPQRAEAERRGRALKVLLQAATGGSG